MESTRKPAQHRGGGARGRGYHESTKRAGPSSGVSPSKRGAPLKAASHRQAVRRLPPSEKTGFMRYGVGHRGSVLGHSFPGPATHPHIAAIEVALFHSETGEIPYTLMSVDVPLREVLDTFLDDAGLRNRDDYALVHRGQELGREETPQSIGLDAHAVWPAAVFEVVEVGPAILHAQLRKMNNIGAALKIDRGGYETQHAHLSNADILSLAFSFLGLDDLISVTTACVLWHNVSQRLSLLLQLKSSAVPDEEYPAYLNLVAEFSSRLDLEQCRARTHERRQWAKLNVKKYHAPQRRRWGRPNMFTKAAGCTSMRTVQTSCLTNEVWRRTLSLRSPHLGFMVWEDEDEPNFQTQIEMAGATAEASAPLNGQDQVAYGESINTTQAAANEAVYTPQSSSFRGDDSQPKVITEADAELRSISISLFRSYFSPSMHFIFPLIAHQQEVNGLDFRSTQTWGVRHGDGAPVGAVAWRFREPAIAHLEDSFSPPAIAVTSTPVHSTQPVLEVLFIAVWERHRHAECGGAMVTALEAEAKNRGCKYMYVEVGEEQPKARKFWGGLGFVPCGEAGVSMEQSLFFDYSCLRFADTEQFVKTVGCESENL